MNNKVKILELFGGIGACTKAFKRLGIPHEIVDYVEIDKYAVASFNAINGTNFEPQDITTWNKDLQVDLIMHGSPCQDFSLAGKQAGGDKDSGTRSSLMYETIRIVEKLKPKYVIWENVKNLLSQKHRHNFDTYIERMEQLGYKNYYQVLNAKDYGIPQNRERVFTISKLDDEPFEFPSKQELKLKLKDMLEDEVDEKYYLSNKMTQFFIYNEQKQIENGNGFRFNVTDGDGINISSRMKWQRGNVQKESIQTITTKGGDDRAVCVIGGIGEKKSNGGTQWYQQDRIYNNNISLSLSTTAMPYYPDNNLRIRKLTSKECWRLMGFDDEDFNKAQATGMSNTQLYKQAGNSIVVNILEEIIKKLLEIINEG